MPIPPSNPLSAPRRLLRDVVFDKMLGAIVDGTLEPGERLNDDELAKWLQVSRTPIREAIAQLQTYGLVEIEANRYTKVAERDAAIYAEAAQFLAGLHLLARQWGVDNLDTATREDLASSLRSVTEQLKARDVDGPTALLDVQGAFAAASGNNLFAEAERPLRVRVKFLSPREADAYDWDALATVAGDLQNLVEG